MQGFSMVGGYLEDLKKKKKKKNLKIGGWALVRVWALAWDNTVLIMGW